MAYSKIAFLKIRRQYLNQSDPNFSDALAERHIWQHSFSQHIILPKDSSHQFTFLQQWKEGLVLKSSKKQTTQLASNKISPVKVLLSHDSFFLGGDNPWVGPTRNPTVILPNFKQYTLVMPPQDASSKIFAKSYLRDICRRRRFLTKKFQTVSRIMSSSEDFLLLLPMLENCDIFGRFKTLSPTIRCHFSPRRIRLKSLKNSVTET